MLTGWSQIVEVSIARRMSFLENISEILFEVLDASLSSSSSPDCSVKMATILSQVALTCMAKLREERFLSPRGIESDNITCLDVILVKQLSNSACHSILFKLIISILRQETSELLRRRQYALLLSYFQYCQHVLDPDVPASVVQYLLRGEQDGEEDVDLKKVDKEQAELARANFSILRKEAQTLLDLVSAFLFGYTAMVDMCQIDCNREQLITLLLPLAEQLLNILLIHFQDGWDSSEGTKMMITYGEKVESGHDMSSLCGKLLPNLEKLESLSEEKVGHDLKGFRRLLGSLKELTIQNLAI